MLERERIVEQAMEMFLYDGVKSIRMDDIATALYMSKRTLYELFGDKESLLVECVSYFHKQINEKQRTAIKGAANVIEELMLALEQWELSSEQNYKLMANLKKFYPRAHDTIRENRHKSGNLMLKLRLEKGVEQGIFLNDIDIDVAVQLFTDSLISMISGAEKTSANVISHRDVFQYLIIYFFRGIATEKGIKLIEIYRAKLKLKF